jgi:hypothetical protein
VTKIAVLISGAFREFEIAHKSWKFLDNPDVDVYFSTWETTKQHNDKLNIHVDETVTEYNIRRLIPNCKGVDIGSAITCNIACKNNNHRMINRWMAGIALVKVSNIKYDVCLIIRPDLYFKYDVNVAHFFEWLNEINEMNEDRIYTFTTESVVHMWIQDQMIIGKYESIIKLINLPVSELHNTVDIHVWLAKKISKIFKYAPKTIKGVGKQICIVRPNSRNKPHIDFEIASKDSDKWYRSLNSQDTIIKEFSGLSGSKVLMIKSLNDFIIRKIDNIERNYEKLILLNQNNFLVPKIIDKEENVLDMEYISGYDMKTFIKLDNIHKFVNFVIDTMNRFKNINTQEKNYTLIYKNQLDCFKNDNKLPFTITELLNKLPKILPSGFCHGDFTLNNIIYKEPNFYMIDPDSNAYNSWIFDIVKLRHDLDGKWFIRHENKNEFNLKLSAIKQELVIAFPEAFNDYLYILILLRVYKYSQKGTIEQKMLLEEMNRVWK